MGSKGEVDDAGVRLFYMGKEPLFPCAWGLSSALLGPTRCPLRFRTFAVAKVTPPHATTKALPATGRAEGTSNCSVYHDS